MKRVLHVLNSLERSGMEKMLLSSYDEWLRLGWKCDILATAGEIGPLAGPLTDAGYGVFHLPLRKRLGFLPDWKFVRDFYRLCRSGYDIVHIHPERAAPLYAAVAKLAGVKVLALTKHNVFSFTGPLRLRKVGERFMIRSLGGRYGMISEGVQSAERIRFKNRGVRIWNWLDDQHFRPPTSEERRAARESLALVDEDFAVVSVGNCNAAKNHVVVLEAIAMLGGDDIPLRYLHAGKEAAGTPERELADQLGIAERVRFLGSLEDPLSLFWAADAFVMPSLYEGLGIAALEAIASGVPAILSHVEGLADVAAEAKDVYLVDTTAATLATAIRHLASVPPEARQRAAEAASKRIRERFSIRRGVRSSVDSLYRMAS